jgi:hypothetical protein
MFSLTLITLNVRVIHTTVFEYQNQVIFNMTSVVFLTVDLGCYIDTCFWYPNKMSFSNTKSKSFFNVTLFEGGVSVSA